MRVHVLGICGTFMGGVALIARELGFEVSGCDLNAYPPMSTMLQASGIPLHEGYNPAWLDPAPDLLVIGNAFSRGNPMVEYALDRGIPYVSGPEFLARYVLQNRWVLAVAGTHGKTTTSSMLAWILEYAELTPGYLIGGAPCNFDAPARLGATPFFVVEADEYDSAFFDKRSKFVHYHPLTLVMNNLEYDHADIFPDLGAIQRQFHHLVRTVPSTGLIIAPSDDDALAEVIRMGCWTPLERFRRGGDAGRVGEWSARLHDDGAGFTLFHGNEAQGDLRWSILGRHNIDNAIAAMLAARHVGVPLATSLEALTQFSGVRRRLEHRGTVRGIRVYDDFAHHPTAVTTTVDGLRRVVGDDRIIAVMEMRSNTMKMGVHKDTIAPALGQADEVVLFQPPDLGWSLQNIADDLGARARVIDSVPAIVDYLVANARAGDHILIMSNGGFGGIHERLLKALGAGENNA
ncbi:MAG: UDP-N-acetylmuramate:L-alanyl-gamma-D-glutamyl-meso-diaminopimelate ligase [Chromatiales bacterium]|jgi:UDP-N-acetylmuramate: L-alanyl-gamma-D-glutamyl-meso-diaminopimelate ligase|nr:UDP-N-acetylmuramate:L-alanyl-gamma-D-glutamyl-meso-diaminopimelate ligase [Chromatiales bacterium]